MTTLTHERGGVAHLHLGVRKKVARLVDLARTTPIGDGRMASEDPVIRQRVASVYLEAELLKLLADRAISAMIHNRPLGPESSAPKTSAPGADQKPKDSSKGLFGRFFG